MPARKPEECDLLLLEAVQKGDIDAALELYESQANFVMAPGDVVEGHAAIRRVLEGFAAAMAGGKMDAVSVTTSPDGTLAVTRTRGSSTVLGPDGEPMTVPFHSVEVVRKQPDGTWRFVIDDPIGEGAYEVPVGWHAE
jgi:uncharacterized protein (TIGR02246 family)